MTATASLPPELTPGALEEHKIRVFDDGGRVEFERASTGWLKADGTTRERDHRAYYFTPPARVCDECNGEKKLYDKSTRGRRCPTCGGTGNPSRRTRVISVSSILDAVCPKGGLPHWSEARGIEAGVEAVRRGLIDLRNDDDIANAVSIVREAGIGAEKARRAAADRGLNVHALLEAYMETSAIPQLKDHPAEHHAYIRGLSGWLAEADPHPEVVEQLVCSPTRRYAGRMDLRARIGGVLTSVDFKSQEKGYSFRAAHLQLNLYEQAAVECGDGPADRLMIVVFDDRGRWREVPADRPDSFTDAALYWLQESRPVDALCDAGNRKVAAARELESA